MINIARTLTMIRGSRLATPLFQTTTRQLTNPAEDDKSSGKSFKFNNFTIDELVGILERENARDLFVCTVPKDYKYVDYMVVCCGHNFRSMSALSHIVRHHYKNKNFENINLLPKIEGEKSKDWMALDLGNIALHIFSKTAREAYDLETLWSLGHSNQRPNTDHLEN